MPTGSRGATVVAPQALWLMNSDLVMDSAEAFAGRLLNESSADASKVESAYRTILGRRPKPDETTRALAFIDRAVAGARLNAAEVESGAIERAWMLLIQSLLASNEFIYVR
jgi:hypothetical protein